MNEDAMWKQLMFDKVKSIESELQQYKEKNSQLERRVYQLEMLNIKLTGDNNSNSVVEEKISLTRGSAREKIIDRINFNLNGEYARKANRSEGSGIVVELPNKCDPDGDIISFGTNYRCKFYYSQLYQGNNPTSWSTVNRDALEFDIFVFSIAILDNDEVDDDPNLYCLIFTQEELKSLISNSGKAVDKTGKYHFYFKVTQEEDQVTVLEVRDVEQDVSYALDNFGAFQPGYEFKGHDI